MKWIKWVEILTLTRKLLERRRSNLFIASFEYILYTKLDALDPSRPDPGQREKINLNFYFHTSLWCLKRFCEGLKGLHKTF